MSILDENLKVTLNSALKLDYVVVNRDVTYNPRYKTASEDEIKSGTNQMLEVEELDRCLDMDFWLRFFRKFINFNPNKNKFFVKTEFTPTFGTKKFPKLSIILCRKAMRGGYTLSTIHIKFSVLEDNFAAWLNDQINWKTYDHSF